MATRSPVSGAGRPAGWVGHPAWLVAFVPVTVFAFPQRLGDHVIDAGLWLGPLSVTCLLVGTSGLAPRRAAARGFLAGWFAHAAILHWIYVVTVQHGGASPPIGVLAVLAIGVYPAVATAGIAAGMAWFGRGGFATPLVAAAVFTLGDHLREFVASGFPWSLLGYTQLANPGLMPLAGFGAVHLVGFGAALGGALLAASIDWRSGRLGSGRHVAIGALAWVALHAWGVSIAADPGASTDPKLRVAVLQGNIAQVRKWSPEYLAQTLSHYETLTRAAAAAGADLIVWPETAVPSPIEFDREAFERVSQLARSAGVSLVVGSVGVELSPTSGSVAAWYDSAFAIEPDGGFVARYDKTKLVPFGEYVPFRALLGRFIGALARGVAVLDVSAGASAVAMQIGVIDRSRGVARSVRLGVPICYELLFPGQVRSFVVDGAELLVAITNDAWYGRTGAPDQFLAITAMRAAENGVGLVRAANTGFSAIIDGRGRIVERSGLFERGYVIGDVRLGGVRSANGASFFARKGDLFVRACWLGVVGLAAVALRAQWKSNGRTDPGESVTEAARKE